MQRYMPTFFQMSNGPETWAGMKEDSQDGEWYSRADVDAHIAELEAFIKVILPSWPDGDEYPTEVSMLEMQRREIAELEKALRDIADRKSFHTIEEIRAIANNVLMDGSSRE
jgi:hypothetical protein